VPLSLRRWFPVWLFAVGLMVALGIQIIFVRDHLAGGSGQRMNTVFKFGFQIWTLWALGAATAVPLLVHLLRRRETLLGIWIGTLVCLLLPGLLYPLAATPSRLSTRFDPLQPLTLDGLAFMDRATYPFVDDSRNIDVQINLRPDAEAIRWLNENISGTPVFLTSEREFYRAYGMRIAANTGLPTVLGALHQNEQRPPAVVAERERDVQTMWNTADLRQTQQLLRQYRVEYVYVGPIERVLYTPEGIAKWDQLNGLLLTVAYQNSGVTIYRVEQAALAEMAPSNVREITAADTETATLEAAVAADPDDSSRAFALGLRYMEHDRAADAVRTLEAAARAHPDDVPLHHLLGDALARVGRTDDAVAAWQHAVDVERTVNNLTKLGRELLSLDRWADAERTLNEALALDPAFGEALWALGEVYRVRGDREQAIVQYRQCMKTSAKDSPWRAEASKALASLGVPTSNNE
jgi:tetratricopeptide (TPR) repeat protein